MDTLEQTRRHLESFAELQAIVRTMKAMAAVSIRQFERSARSLQAYYRTVEAGLSVVFRDVTTVPDPASNARGGRGIVVFGSDHGLCGRFNEEIVDHARRYILHSEVDRPRLLVVGARPAALLEASDRPPEKIMLVPGSAARITATVRRILFEIDEWRTRERIERVELIHNRPRPANRYTPTHFELLPVDLQRLQRLARAPWPSPTLPMYTMPRERLLSALLRQYLFVAIARACAESLAAENASRLVAMQAAEKSMADRSEALLAEYRRRRQDAITSELLDVVSGYEALRSAGD